LTEAGEAEKKLADALEKIHPLKDAAESKRNAVNVAMAAYSRATGTSSEPAPTRRKKATGTRAPRQFLAIAMTTGSRLMKAAKSQGKQKKAALQAAVERLNEIAKKRGEELTEEIKAAIEKRAAEIFTK